MALQNAFGDVANDKTITDLYNMMAYYMDRMEFGLNTDNAKRLKVNIDTGTLSTVSTVTTVSTVGTVANQTQIGGLPAQRIVEAQLDTAFNVGFLSKITF
jgi:hypothetical protein